MAGITAARVKAIAGPGARNDLVNAIVRGWPQAVAKAKITTRLRACHFLAQIMTETGGLQILSESGAYRYETILKIFGAAQYARQYGGRGHSAGIGPDEARRIASLPVDQRGPVLFNRVYGVGNPAKVREFNNTGPNDGWLYRGGGMMQATGKSNYARLEKKTGLPLVAHPELLHQPDSAFVAAYLEWGQDGRCNAAADRDDVKGVRRIINGGENGIAACETFLARAKQVLQDYQPPAVDHLTPATPDPSAADTGPAAPSMPDDPAPAAPSAPVAADVQGDPELFSVQKRLKAMNYTPGVLTGVWGGMTAGALAGFINDRQAAIAVPASVEAFGAEREAIKAELARAEAEHFVRPVTAARANGDVATVTSVAPEAAPVRRNFLTSLWVTITTAAAAVWSTVQDKVQQAWAFVFDHKDDIPTDPGTLSTVWSYVEKVPTSFWLMLLAGVLAFITLDAARGLAKIKQAVQTGARQ
ncbi:putative chitinase [Bradyrhizobium sp. YR681]|uniref:glycoside hydrolase family 19 protein n=1 Tax=Bradyrhizobium sp. YR681 TaxID=1144344 RepID=UPI000271149F|nr:hypothetical protein [Bradyrhizobium sp. YR681]EJN11867.1 putative chitinase [Bradyrhizobium sp. YR681]